MGGISVTIRKNRPASELAIHGPEILIEYDNISWDKEGADHIHTITRDVSNDFGEDILRAHYSAETHPSPPESE